MILDETFIAEYQRELSAVVRSDIARRGWKQKDLAEATGMTQARVSRLLHDRSEWTVRDLLAVASALATPIGELLPPERALDEPPLHGFTTFDGRPM